MTKADSTEINPPVLEKLRQRLRERPVRQSLAPVKKYLARNVSLSPETTVVQVVGSNGKGSTIHFLEQILLSLAQTTVAYTSPHLVKIGERIRFNGKPLKTEKFASYLQEIIAGSEFELTPFEQMFLVATRLAVARKVEFLLLEAGMGGRWDATSALPANWTICTGVELEHTDFLGETREEILIEKLAQVPESSGLIVPDFPDDLQKIVETEVRNKNLNLERVESEDKFPRSLQRLTLRLAQKILPEMSKTSLKKEIFKTDLPPGRQSLCEYKNTKILLDVGHTPAAVKALFNTLSEREEIRGWTMVYGSLVGKNINEILKIVRDNFSAKNLFFTEPPSPRAASVKALQKNWPGEKISSCRVEDVETGVIEQVDENEGIIITGSFKLVGWFYKNWDL